jgi:hypothetical protein
LASSIIFFISASLGIAEVAVVDVVAGLEAVVVLAAGLMVVVVVFFTGLGAVITGLGAVGAFGAVDGVCATAREAIANKVVSAKVVGFMV